jgi:hypothetical protein
MGLASRGAVAIAALLVALGSSGMAPALTQLGGLGTSAANTDYYQVTCSDDGSGPPTSLVTQVLDAAPLAAPLVSVQTQKGFLATNSTDPVDDDGAPSPEVWVNGGAGVYDVFVDKTEAGAETYLLTVRCKTGADGGGDDTGTLLSSIATGARQVPALGPLGLLGLAGSLVAVGSAALRRRAQA